LEVEVPAERGFTLSNVSIGGERISYGGQIAECITVKLVAVAILSGVEPTPLRWSSHAYIDPAFPIVLGRAEKIGKPAPAGYVEALVGQGEGAVLSTPQANTAVVGSGAFEPELTLTRRP
jgi:hypothetical protein